MEDTKPSLKNIEAFRQALAGYEVSDRARQVLGGVKLVAVSGLAGGGRNTVISQLVANYTFAFIVSDTTRPPKVRDGTLERNGEQYYFRSEEEVLRDIKNGDFLEAEVIHSQQVSGVSIRELERLSTNGRTLISDFEYGGIANVIHAKPDAIAIGLLPPSYDEWVARLSRREVMTDDELQNRMHTAREVLSSMLERPYMQLVINDTIARCAETIDAIVHHDGYTAQMHAIGRQTAEAILQGIIEHAK